jgi:RNA polymerase sigma-70 factor (ECF subfamily)
MSVTEREGAQAGLAGSPVWGYREDIHRLARQLCRHREDAEDVTQSALLKAAEHLDGFRAEASLRTWLHRIATNECRMLRRRRPPRSLEELLDAAAAGAAVEPPGESPDPELLAVAVEEQRRVLQALAALPPGYRTVLLLADGRRLHAAEIAALLETTVPSVRSSLHRARQALHAQLR